MKRAFLICLGLIIFFFGTGIAYSQYDEGKADAPYSRGSRSKTQYYPIKFINNCSKDDIYIAIRYCTFDSNGKKFWVVRGWEKLPFRKTVTIPNSAKKYIYYYAHNDTKEWEGKYECKISDKDFGYAEKKKGNFKSRKIKGFIRGRKKITFSCSD